MVLILNGRGILVIPVKKRASEAHDLGEEKLKKRLKLTVDEGASKVILIFFLGFLFRLLLVSECRCF